MPRECRFDVQGWTGVVGGLQMWMLGLVWFWIHFAWLAGVRAVRRYTFLTQAIAGEGGGT